MKVKIDYICLNPECKMYAKVQTLQVERDIAYDRFVFVNCPYCNDPLERI